MTAYITIPDADINPDKPIKSATGYALRDNPLAIAEGDATAPSINPAALLIGGKGGDGVLNNAASLTGIGFYEFSSVLVTSAKSIPVGSIIRIAGNATLSAVLTVTQISDAAATRLQERAQLEVLNAIFGIQSPGVGNGGGSIGGDGVFVFSGGSGGARGKNLGSCFRPWAARRPFIGGDGGTTGKGGGGGGVIIIVEGNFDLTGGTINANGKAGTIGNDDGGGAGSIIVICTGTMTNGTFNARGGASVGGGAPGGSGLIQLVAATFSGTQTKDVSGVSGGGYTSEAGSQSSTTLTRDQIRTILQRM